MKNIIISWPNSNQKVVAREWAGKPTNRLKNQPNWEAKKQAGKPTRLGSQQTGWEANRLGSQQNKKWSHIWRKKLSSDPPCRPFKWTERCALSLWFVLRLHQSNSTRCLQITTINMKKHSKISSHWSMPILKFRISNDIDWKNPCLRLQIWSLVSLIQFPNHYMK